MTYEEYWAGRRAWFAAQQAEYFDFGWAAVGDYFVDWRDIPVFIVNRDRLDTGFRSLVDWLADTGCRRVTVLDNGSTYPPLLRYYNEHARSVRNPHASFEVRHMDYNGGPWVFWDHRMQDRILPTPYIVTDADVAPDAGCPRDIIERMLVVLKQHPGRVVKVGPGLRVDNLPDCYAKKEAMLGFERAYTAEESRRSWPPPTGRRRTRPTCSRRASTRPSPCTARGRRS